MKIITLLTRFHAHELPNLSSNECANLRQMLRNLLAVPPFEGVLMIAITDLQSPQRARGRYEQAVAQRQSDRIGSEQYQQASIRCDIDPGEFSGQKE